MQFAIDENGIRTSINNSIKGKPYKCPCCGSDCGRVEKHRSDEAAGKLGAVFFIFYAKIFCIKYLTFPATHAIMAP